VALVNLCQLDPDVVALFAPAFYIGAFGLHLGGVLELPLVVLVDVCRRADLVGLRVWPKVF
jgi:hypothetical protein